MGKNLFPHARRPRKTKIAKRRSPWTRRINAANTARLFNIWGLISD
jgi:hypothetical protein